MTTDRTQPAPITPESKDWTRVIVEGCAECGFQPQEVSTTGERLRATIPIWQDRLRRPDATGRPSPTTWSPVEYACHVRDTCRIFRERLRLMLDEDDPMFDNWDQDATAVAEDYYHQEPSAVADQLTAEATATAQAFDGVPAGAWERPGRRSNGSLFTVGTFAVYFLHDIEHHVHDVAPTPPR